MLYEVITADRDLYQALVAERSLLLLDKDAPDFENLARYHKENMEQSEERWKKFVALPGTEQEKSIISDYRKLHEKWTVLSGKVVEGVITSYSIHYTKLYEKRTS